MIYRVIRPLKIKTHDGKELLFQKDSTFDSSERVMLEGVEEISNNLIYENFNPWWFADYRITEIWKMGFTGKGVKVAVLDSGIYLENGQPHHDMDILPQNVCDKSNSASGLRDWDGHGVHISGIIKASNNGKGITGIAYNSDFYFVKIANDKDGTKLNYLTDAIQWAVEKQVHIINISQGHYKISNSEKEKLYKLIQSAYENNILIVCAAGNKDAVTGDDFYPARFDETIAVGGINDKKLPLENSVTLANIDISAPGDKINSTSKTGEYSECCGSSQACAYTTGVVSLVIEKLLIQHKPFTPAKLKRALLEHSDTIGQIKIINPLKIVEKIL